MKLAVNTQTMEKPPPLESSQTAFIIPETIFKQLRSVQTGISEITFGSIIIADYLYP